MKKLVLIALVFMLIISSLNFAAAQTFNVSVKGIPQSQQPVSVKLGENVPVTITLTTNSDMEGIIAVAELEHSEGTAIAKTDPFDVEENVTYVLEYEDGLTIGIPNDAEEKEYNITVRLEDEDGDLISENGIDYETKFRIIIQREYNKLEIGSINIPDVFEAGERSLISISVKNIGSKDQDDVYLEARIPQLGIISETLAGDLSSDKEDDDNELSVELPMNFPEATETGAYVMYIRAYNEKTSSELTRDIRIEGVEREVLLTDITPLSIIEDIEQGKRGVFKIVILNLGTEDQTYTTELGEKVDWATVQIEPKKVTLERDQNAVIEVFVAPNENVIGEKVLKITIRDEKGIIDDISLVADIKETLSAASNLSPVMTSLIGAAIIAFFLIIIFMGFKFKGEVKKRMQAAEVVSEAKEIGRSEARNEAINEASNLVSSIMDKVLQAKDEYKEVAKERAAGRANNVMQNLAEDEVEEVFDKAIKNLEEKKYEEIGGDKDKRKEVGAQIRNNANDVLEKVANRVSEEEVDMDNVVDNVTEKLAEEEVDGVGVPTSIETLTKIRQKLGEQIEALKSEEEEEVIGDASKGKAKKKFKLKSFKKQKK